MRSSASRALLLRAGSIVPLRFGGRVTHRTLTPLAVLVRNRSPSLATRFGVTKPENITIDSFALAMSASTAASNVDWLNTPIVFASMSNGTRSKGPEGLFRWDAWRAVPRLGLRGPFAACHTGFPAGGSNWGVIDQG